jgi:hypothetical protein
MEPAVRAKLHSTKGGDRETELKEFAVKPTKVPSLARAVTMVTPVANMPKAPRNSVLEKLGEMARVGRTLVSMPPIYLKSGNLQ